MAAVVRQAPTTPLVKLTRAASIACIRGYQYTLGAVLVDRCRFYPSCSSYAIEAIEMHGVLRGVALALKRVTKCHPFHPGGVDPVPKPSVVSGSSRGRE